MPRLTPMEQLLAFCDLERAQNPPAPGHRHIAEWAAQEIERLNFRVAALEAQLAEAHGGGP